MRKLNIGTNNYTEVYATDEPAFNANHEYIVSAVNSTNDYAKVSFQKGPIKENGVNGCHNEDLMWLNKRTLDRRSRGVVGTSQK